MVAFWAISMSLTCTQFARADEWAIEPSVTLRSGYDDNIRLTTAPHDSVTSSTLSPEVVLRKKTEVSDISVRGKLAVNRYWGEPTLNTTDQSYYLNSSFLNERNRLSFDASYLRDSTLRTELFETGGVAARTQRGSLRLSPQWSWSFSPMTSVGATYSFTDARYDDAQKAGLTNYRSQELLFWLGRKLSDRDELQLNTSYSKYQTRPAAFESDTVGVSLNYSRDFSELTKLSSQLGVRRTESSRQAFTQLFVPIAPGFFQLVLVPQRIDTKDTGMLLNVGITSHLADRTALRGRLTRELNPSGSGSLVEIDRVSAGVTHGFTEQTALDVDLAVSRTRFSDDALSASNSRYYAVQTQINSRLDEHWSVSAGYSYARLEYEGTAASADANTIFLSARYDWRKIAISR